VNDEAQPEYQEEATEWPAEDDEEYEVKERTQRSREGRHPLGNYEKGHLDRDSVMEDSNETEDNNETKNVHEDPFAIIKKPQIDLMKAGAKKAFADEKAAAAEKNVAELDKMLTKSQRENATEDETIAAKNEKITELEEKLTNSEKENASTKTDLEESKEETAAAKE
jgi:hypothetical protein